mmetsp:Transcript_49524/g.130252  ORF Transcript_49524/g.130252 Transcript_49524/m.130252 type:complete len:230 (-) Transcript_49524:14-703(-)
MVAPHANAHVPSTSQHSRCLGPRQEHTASLRLGLGGDSALRLDLALGAAPSLQVAGVVRRELGPVGHTPLRHLLALVHLRVDARGADQKQRHLDEEGDDHEDQTHHGRPHAPRLLFRAARVEADDEHGGHRYDQVHADPNLAAVRHHFGRVTRSSVLAAGDVADHRCIRASLLHITKTLQALRQIWMWLRALSHAGKYRFGALQQLVHPHRRSIRTAVGNQRPICSGGT